eukprot:507299-Pleurochrysis_carterae.AAC.2
MPRRAEEDLAERGAPPRVRSVCDHVARVARTPDAPAHPASRILPAPCARRIVRVDAQWHRGRGTARWPDVALLTKHMQRPHTLQAARLHVCAGSCTPAATPRS